MDAVGNVTPIIGLLVRILQADLYPDHVTVLYTVHDSSRDQSTIAPFSDIRSVSLISPSSTNLGILTCWLATCFVSCYRAAPSSGHGRGYVASVCSDLGKLALLGAIHIHCSWQESRPLFGLIPYFGQFPRIFVIEHRLFKES